MKKILDEQTKHRLIGAIVVLALMIIFLPAMMRHSDQSFDEFTSFRIPKKPALPKAATVDQKTMFKSVKIATVTLPHTAESHSNIAEAQSLSQTTSQAQTVTLAKIAEQKQQSAETKAMKSNEVFTIQLASFNQEANAQALITQLRLKGFAALKQTVTSPEGTVYQVIVGQVKQREQAIDLQKKLVNNTHLNGLIIKTKVS